MSRLAFHDLLRHHRMRCSLTLAALTNQTGISRSHLGNLEQGRRAPSGEHARLLIKALGLDAEEARIWLAAAAEAHIPSDLRG